jgi:hypothetical protein
MKSENHDRILYIFHREAETGVSLLKKTMEAGAGCTIKNQKAAPERAVLERHKILVSLTGSLYKADMQVLY